MDSKFQPNDIVEVVKHPKPRFVGIQGAVKNITSQEFGNRTRIFYDLTPIYPSGVRNCSEFRRII